MKPNTTPPSCDRPRGLDRLPRLFGWLLTALLLALAVYLIAPHQLQVSLYKVSLVVMGGLFGYWMDRSFFPYGRPHQFLPCPVSLEVREDLKAHEEPYEIVAGVLDMASIAIAAACMLRRALIVAASMLAMGLGA